MTSLYLANCEALSKFDASGTKEWASIYKVIHLNVSLVDRLEKVNLPYNFKLYEPFKLPTDLSSTLSYEDCCDKRAEELYLQSKKLNVPIVVLYSGGIDSTLVLVSFLKVIPEQELRQKLIVAMSLDSIRENPNFYYNTIRKRCSIISSDNFSSLFNGNYLVVGGEHNDQLLGTDVAGRYYRLFSFAELHEKYNEQNISKFFLYAGMSESDAKLWYYIIDNHIKSSPIRIETVFQFFWWLNFIFKWQSVFFRILLRVSPVDRSNINQTFVDNYFHHFFSADYFQVWSMKNPHLKVKDSWDSYKFIAKEVIYNYTKDSDYLNNKVKIGSLYKLFLQKDTPIGLTSEYDYLYNIVPGDFYNAKNDFTN
jgi:hypothetical protein